jgi:hypothetical protein
VESALNDGDGAASERPSEYLGVLLLNRRLSGKDLTSNVYEVCVVREYIGV